MTIDGHLNVAKFLLDNQADVNAKDNDGMTSLHYALNYVQEGKLDLQFHIIADRCITHGLNTFSCRPEIGYYQRITQIWC